MTTLGEPRVLTGTPEEIKQQLRRLQARGLVRWVGPPVPRPGGGGFQVEWIPNFPQTHGRTWARLRPVWVPRWWDDRQRLATWAAVVGGVLLLVAGVLWLITQAVTGVTSALAGNREVAALLVTAGVLGVVGWLARSRSTRGSSGRN